MLPPHHRPPSPPPPVLPLQGEDLRKSSANSEPPMRPHTLAAAQAIPIGALTLTVPGPLADPARLDPAHWRALDRLIAAEASGFHDLAAVIQPELERRLGVTPDDRLVAGSAPDPAAFTPAEIARLDAAEAVLAAPHARAPKASDLDRKRREARLAILDLQRDRARRVARAEDAEVARGLAETAALASARGEPLAADRVAGRLRARRLTALEKALQSGYLDGGPVRPESLLRAGEAYRDAYEIAVGERGPTRDLSRAPQPGTFGPRTPTTPILASLRLAQMRGEPVRKRAGEEPEGAATVASKRRKALRMLTDRERQACDLICGQDLTVNATAERLSADRNALGVALRRALTAVGENCGWW